MLLLRSCFQLGALHVFIQSSTQNWWLLLNDFFSAFLRLRFLHLLTQDYVLAFDKEFAKFILLELQMCFEVQAHVYSHLF